MPIAKEALPEAIVPAPSAVADVFVDFARLPTARELVEPDAVLPIPIDMAVTSPPVVLPPSTAYCA